MKKIIYLMLTLLVVLATSCSNDEIEIAKESPIHTLTYNVSTQAAYDQIGVTNSYKNNFLSSDESYELGVYTFIYDTDGNLAASDSTYTKTFTNVSQSYNLKEGTYTAITIEMLVDADDDYVSDYWMIVGKEKMSSLEIERTRSNIYYGGVVAVSTETISVEGNALSVTVTPSPLGALIQTDFHNFDQSDYTWISFLTKNKPIGRYLSPQLNGTDRFHYDHYLETNTWSPRGETYSKNLSSDEGFTIYIIEEGSIQYGLAPSTYDDDYNVNSFWLYPNNGDAYLTVVDGSRYYGGLWYTGNGGSNDCEGFVGTENEYNTWLSNTDRTVNNGDFSYQEPYVQWGGSVSSVQSFMNKYTMTVGSNGAAVAQSDGSYGLEYSGLDNETAIQYFFTSVTTGLFESDMFFDKTKYSIDVINSSMSGNTLLAEQDGSYIYLSADSKSYIIIFNSGDYNIIGYVDVNYFASSSAKAQSKSNVKTSKAVELINSMHYLLK